jgi:hypothetical protein
MGGGVFGEGSFIPTAREIAQAEIVDDWLVWLGSHHCGVRLLVSWAHDDPIWRIADRERCSVRTAHNRIDRAVADPEGVWGYGDGASMMEERPDQGPPAELHDRTAAGVTFAESKVHSGWAVGGGLEYLFMPSWSGKAEYMYADYGNEAYLIAFAPGGIGLGVTTHTVKAGVNYHFGGPVVVALLSEGGV